MPADVQFATKPELARMMLGRALDSGMPAAWVTADEAYGRDRKFRAWLEQRRVGYVVAVDSRQAITGDAGTSRADALAAHAPEQAARQARQAQALVEETRLDHYSASAIVHVAVARVALHEGRHSDARAALARVHRLRPLLDHGLPWLTVQVGLELTRAQLALGEAAAARTVLTETERVLERRPDLGSLAHEAGELRERVAATSGPEGAWAMSLTAAELRLLPYLAPHLTFVEIGQRLYLSQNTVKTQANAIYRKPPGFLTQRGDRARHPGRALGQHHLPTAVASLESMRRGTESLTSLPFLDWANAGGQEARLPRFT